MAEQWRSTLKAEVDSFPPPLHFRSRSVASHEALGRLAEVVNITTILLAILGTGAGDDHCTVGTALASVLDYGRPLLGVMLLAAGSWLLLLS